MLQCGHDGPLPAACPPRRCAESVRTDVRVSQQKKGHNPMAKKAAKKKVAKKKVAKKKVTKKKKATRKR